MLKKVVRKGALLSMTLFFMGWADVFGGVAEIV